MILPLPSPAYLQLTGRLKELINRGGEKISPLEVDNALLEIESVKEAVCFGVPDPKGVLGEIVWAGVVLHAGYSGEGEEKRIKDAMQNKVAKFKIPERYLQLFPCESVYANQNPNRVIIAKEIPKTATGKIQRRFVREAFMKLAREQNGSKL